MQDKQGGHDGRALQQPQYRSSQQRVPILSDLPYIGELFTGKNESKEVTQLIFFLKIHIISPEQVASGVFYDFDRNAKVSEKLNQIVVHSDSFPSHDASLKKFKDEIEGRCPAGNSSAAGVQGPLRSPSMTPRRRVPRRSGRSTPRCSSWSRRRSRNRRRRSPRPGLLTEKPAVRVTVEPKEGAETPEVTEPAPADVVETEKPANSDSAATDGK